MGTLLNIKMKLATLFVAAVSAMNVEQMKAQTMDLVAQADGGAVVKCFIQFGKDIESCEEILANDPACQEDGPGFDPIKCNKDFIGCFLCAFGGVPQCLA